MSQQNNILIRNASLHEFAALGRLMVKVYSQLEGFPSPQDQPQYYELLSNIGDFTQYPGTELLVAVSSEKMPQNKLENKLLGGVVYFRHMRYYGSGGSAPLETQAAGFRLLAVSPEARGLGVGRALSEACIKKATAQKRKQLIIHTTKSMEIAWSMYEKLGFVRSPDLDFYQEKLPVFGFRLNLE